MEDVHLLRPILMFEVDANNNNKTLGWSMMKHAEPRQWIARKQHGSRKDHSVEAEVVGADDFMPAICWTRCFMEAQGYGVLDNVLYQDNRTSMLLEKNGKASSTKRTKHINIRYFFITDRIAKGELNVEWCPTGDMIGDFMTKPLQGALFRKFRDQIMGVVPARSPGSGKPTTGNMAQYSNEESRHRSVLGKRVKSKNSAHARADLG